MVNPQPSIPLQKQEIASNTHHYVTNLIANPQKNTMEVVDRNNGFHEHQQENTSRPDSSGKDDEPTSSDHSSRSSTPSIQSLTDQTQIAQILDVSTYSFEKSLHSLILLSFTPVCFRFLFLQWQT